MEAREISYLNELAAQIVINGGLEGKDVVAEITKAHQQRQDFIAEMQNGSSLRSVMARKAITTAVYVRAKGLAEFNKFISHCEQLDHYTSVEEARQLMGLA